MTLFMNTTQYYKIVIVLPFVAILTFASFLTSAQETFQNLDFEQANPVSIVGSPYYPYAVTVASALPYWSVSYGTVQQTRMFYDAPSAGATQVTLVGDGYGAIDGNYSVLLQGGITVSAASISQSGLIPLGTQSLFFEAQPTSGAFDVFIGSQAIPFTAVGTGPNYTLYGASISAWAGQTEQLTFSALENENSYWIIDDISFSTNAVVPEPGIVALTAIGGLLFGARKWLARY
jgi:hypothetical protein